MLTFLLAAAISYTLTNTSVPQPPTAPAMAVWTSEPATREAVEFLAKDGSKIRGWIQRAKQVDDGGMVASHPFVLFFYGSNENLVHEEARLAWLRDKLHVNAVCFDFPRYGFSTGKLSVKSPVKLLSKSMTSFTTILLPKGRELMALCLQSSHTAGQSERN